MNKPPYTVVTADQYVDMVPENWTRFSISLSISSSCNR